MGSKIANKPFSMSTTVRNIDRVDSLLSVLIELEKAQKNTYQSKKRNSIESKESKMLIVKEIIRSGFVSSGRVDKDIRDSIKMGIFLSDNQVDRFLLQASQGPGWPGRFSNYMNKLEALGLAFRNKNSCKVEVTNLGREFLVQPQKVTIWSLANIPTKNMTSRNLNNFTPLGVLAKYFNKYKNKRHISKEKLATLISLPTSDEVDKVDFNKINDLAVAKKYTTTKISDKTYYDYENELGMTLIFAGLFKKDFNGYRPTELFLSNLNIFMSVERKAIKAVNEIFEYEEYISYINNYILEDVFPISNEPNEVLIKRISKEFSYEFIINSILSVSNHEYIDIPGIENDIKGFVLIEWLFALLFAKDENCKVKPNICLNFDGYPISQAPGGKADIELKQFENKINVEITLLTNAKQQENSETTSVAFHARESKVKKVYLLAPQIHERVLEYFEFVEHKHKIEMNAFSFKEFFMKKKYLNL